MVAERASRPVVVVSGAGREGVAAELDRRYGEDYDVRHLPDAAAALEAVATLGTGGAPVVLAIAADESDGTDGSDGSGAPDGTGAPPSEPSDPVAALFAAVRHAFPDARRALLIDWGGWGEERTAARLLDLMSRGAMDTYLVAPRHRPDESFHATVTELLREWALAADGDRPGFTLVGDPEATRSHVLRSRLDRAGVAVHQLAPDDPDAAELLAEAGVAGGVAAGRPGGGATVPIVATADGRILVDPDDAELARASGLTTELPDGPVEVVVVGAGPAGLAAAVYAASEGLATLVLEGSVVGGQAGSSSLIRNYLGFARGVAGAELAQRAYRQAWLFGARFAHARRATALEVDGDLFRIEVDGVADGGADGSRAESVVTRSIVVATGVDYRRLAVPALAPFVGGSVFYGASSVEARAQRGRDVLVVGGGNSAGQAALHVARFARSVSLVVRGAHLAESMSGYLVHELEAAGVHVITGSRVVDARPASEGDRLGAVVLEHASGDRLEVPAGALFVTIGARPRTEWLGPRVLRDRWASVVTGTDVLGDLEGTREAVPDDPAMWTLDRDPEPYETSLPGVYAVGDVRRGSLRRVAAAVGEGSAVVSAVHRHLGPHVGG